MEINKDLISIHAYLCADGYVIKSNNPKYKYFHIGFRNTNLDLLKDFQIKFYRYFKIKPYLIEGQRCRIGSKEIYNSLTEKFGSFYSYEWKMPELNDQLKKIWLRSFFDCEAWVTLEKHQNRNIGLDNVNKKGINQIKNALKEMGINCVLRYREKQNIYRLYIYGKENIILYKSEIGFLHPNKLKKLNDAINDYVDYEWKFPHEEEKLKSFVFNLLKEKIRIKGSRYIRIFSKEENNLIKLKEGVEKYFGMSSLVNKRVNGLGTIYYELSINKKEEIQKLIKLKIIPNILKD